MADPYIDPQETQSYGPFARDQMAKVCKGLVPALDSAVEHCIAAQKKADLAMKAAIDASPAKPAAASSNADVIDARDALVRFGSYLGSLKGSPVDPILFFGKDAPSIFARRRLTKLVAALASFSEKIEKNKSKLPGYKTWLTEFDDLHTKVNAFETKQRAAKVDVADLGPELAAARESWLDVYTANKAVITGVLRHAGKLQMLPLIFDDLAEVHRAAGVSDTDGASDGTAATAASAPIPAASKPAS